MSLPACELFEWKSWCVHFTIEAKRFAPFWTRPGPSSGHRNPEIAESHTITVPKVTFLDLQRNHLNAHLEQEKPLVERFGRKLTPLARRGRLKSRIPSLTLKQNRECHVFIIGKGGPDLNFFLGKTQFCEKLPGEFNCQNQFGRHIVSPNWFSMFFYSTPTLWHWVSPREKSNPRWNSKSAKVWFLLRACIVTQYVKIMDSQLLPNTENLTSSKYSNAKWVYQRVDFLNGKVDVSILL